MGTNHDLPLSVLPDYCLDIILACKHFVGEGADDGGDAEEFHQGLKIILKENPGQDNWLASFSPDAREFIKKYFLLFFENTLPWFELPANLNIGLLNFQIAYQIVTYACRGLLFSPTTEETNIQSMDLELSEKYQGTG